MSQEFERLREEQERQERGKPSTHSAALLGCLLEMSQAVLRAECCHREGAGAVPGTDSLEMQGWVRSAQLL